MIYQYPQITTTRLLVCKTEEELIDETNTFDSSIQFDPYYSSTEDCIVIAAGSRISKLNNGKNAGIVQIAHETTGFAYLNKIK